MVIFRQEKEQFCHQIWPRKKIRSSQSLYLHIKGVVVGMRLDQPVHAPANHLIQIFDLVGKLVSFKVLDAAPADLGHGEGQREDELEVVTGIKITLWESNQVKHAEES